MYLLFHFTSAKKVVHVKFGVLDFEHFGLYFHTEK